MLDFLLICSPTNSLSLSMLSFTSQCNESRFVCDALEAELKSGTQRWAETAAQNAQISERLTNRSMGMWDECVREGVRGRVCCVFLCNFALSRVR